jgi:hypothetical protein
MYLGKGCAAVGAVGAVSAAALYSASVGMQHIASAQVQVPNATSRVSSMVTCDVASLGVFRSSYTPACAGLPGSAMTVDTLDFWPLFPAQCRFGQLSELSPFGVGSTAFTNCTDYVALTAAQVQAGGMQQLSQGFANMTLDSFSQLNAQLGVVTMLLPVLGVKDNMTEADWANIKQIGDIFGSQVPGVQQLVAIIVQQCAPPAVQSSRLCASSLVDALSAPIGGSSSSEQRTFFTPIGHDPVVFDSYLNMTSTLVQIIRNPKLGQLLEIFNVTIPTQIVNQLVMANDLVHGCSAANKSDATQCATAALVPEDGFAANYPLAPCFSSNHSLGSFYDFARDYVLATRYPDTDKQLQLAYVSLVAAANCALNGDPDAKYCIGVEPAAMALGGFYARTIAPAPTTLAQQPANTRQRMTGIVHNVTQKCLLNDKDIAIFRQSRSEMYAVLAFAWLGALAATALAVPVLFSNRQDRLVRFILPSTATVIALVLSVVALLGLHSAPIYKLVGQACNPGETCYVAGNSIPIAMAAIVIALAAFIAFSTILALPRIDRNLYTWGHAARPPKCEDEQVPNEP